MASDLVTKECRLVMNLTRAPSELLPPPTKISLTGFGAGGVAMEETPPSIIGPMMNEINEKSAWDA